LATGEVKVIRADRVEAVQPLKPGCHERWVFDKNTPTDSVAMVVAVFEPQRSSGMHRHSVEECFYILRGRGRAEIGGREYDLEPDLCIYAPTGTPHNFINTSTCESLVLVATFSKNQFETTQLE